MSIIQKITPYLWFEDQAEDAAKFYCSIFKPSKIIDSSPMIVEFELEGLSFIALNGGPQYTFNEAVSFYVLCKDQNEVDHYWNKLTAGGEEGRCGWLKDRYGISWQVVPKPFVDMMRSKDQAKVMKLITAMQSMNKLVVADLEKAFK